jgi:hypothetical protein
MTRASFLTFFEMGVALGLGLVTGVSALLAFGIACTFLFKVIFTETNHFPELSKMVITDGSV